RDTRREISGATSAKVAASPAGIAGKGDRLRTDRGLAPAARDFLDRLVEHQILGSDSVVQFLDQRHKALDPLTEAESLGNALAEAGLLTRYQLDRILAG